MGQSTELESIEFAENPEPRCPCVLLLDTSSSMSGAPITALNRGLVAFRDDITKDSLASRRLEVALVTFDSEVREVQGFVTADEFHPPTLTAQGSTHMGSAILKALQMIQNRKAQYNANGIAYYRPWVFMITDGEPTDSDVIGQAAGRLRDDEANKRVAFFTVGVEGANMDRLRTIVVRQPLKLVGLKFDDMFLWLSNSMSTVSHSKVDDQVALPPIGWGTP